MILGSASSRIAVLASLALLGAADAATIRQSEPSSWPPPGKGCVRFFSLPAHERAIGFALKSEGVLFEQASWEWTAEGSSGTIDVCVAPSAREAREALFFGVRGRWLAFEPFAPGGVWIGDVSWVPRRHGALLWFCRRNVAVWITVRRPIGGEARKEVVRLSKAIVKAIDSEEVVAEAASVRCPGLDVQAPKELRVGRRATISVLSPAPRPSKLTYGCLPEPSRRLANLNGLTKATATGKADFVVEAKEAGDAVVILYVTDGNGMSRKVVRPIRILPDPARPADGWKERVHCRACGSSFPRGRATCPRCGAKLKAK